MGRQGRGVLVVVGVAIAALVIVARAGYHLAGAPVPAELGRPPAVGDCVLDGLPTAAFAGIDEAGKPVGYPHVITDGCPGLRYAEVVAVLADGLDYQRPADGNVWADPRSPDRRCAAAADAYLGRSGGSAAPRWIPAADTATGIIAPAVQDRRFGAGWLACVVGAAGHGSDPPGQTAYSGSLRHVAQTFQFPAQLARCLSDLPTAAAPFFQVDCAAAHPAELLAWAQADPPTDTIRQRLTAECPALASRLIGAGGAELAGRLDIRVIGLPLAGGETTADEPAIEQFFCVAAPTAGRLLTGPLLALGDRPLPIS